MKKPDASLVNIWWPFCSTTSACVQYSTSSRLRESRLRYTKLSNIHVVRRHISRSSRAILCPSAFAQMLCLQDLTPITNAHLPLRSGINAASSLTHGSEVKHARQLDRLTFIFEYVPRRRCVEQSCASCILLPVFPMGVSYGNERRIFRFFPEAPSSHILSESFRTDFYHFTEATFLNIHSPIPPILYKTASSHFL